jgi:hypothetical protein
LKRFHTSQYLPDELFIHLPFSLWHGWTIVLMFIAAFAAFGVDATHYDPHTSTNIAAFLSLLFLESTAAAYILSSAEGDLPGAVAIAWSLWAIFAYRWNPMPFIHWSALVFAIIALIWVIWGLIKLCRRCGRGSIHLEDEEREPILGGGRSESANV